MSMNAVNVYLVIATAAYLCLVASGANSQPSSVTSYTKLTKAALRVAKRFCHTDTYKKNKLCSDFQDAVKAFKSEVLSLYTADDKLITGATGGSAGHDGDKNTDGSSKGDNKQTNSGANSNNNNNGDTISNYFGNPGISIRK